MPRREGWSNCKNACLDKQDRRIKTKRKTNFKQFILYRKNYDINILLLDRREKSFF